MAAIFLERAGFFNLLHKVTLKRVSTKCITIARPFPVKYCKSTNFGVLLLANTYVLGIIDGTYVGMCEDTGTI